MKLPATDTAELQAKLYIDCIYNKEIVWLIKDLA